MKNKKYMNKEEYEILLNEVHDLMEKESFFMFGSVEYELLCNEIDDKLSLLYGA